MRRLIIVVSAALSALTIISFAAFAAGAQTETTDQYATEETVPQESTTPLPEETTGDPEPYHQVVDNSAAGGFDAPGWQKGPANSSTVGEDYAYADPSDGAGPARFTVEVPETGHYVIYARWPGGQDVTTAARFGVETLSGVQSAEVDQRANAGLWDMVGIYEMEQGQRVVEVSGTASDGGRVVADAVMITGGALVGGGQLASGVNPDELAGDLTADDRSFSADGGGGGGANGRDVARQSKRHIGTKYVSSPPGPCRAFKAEDCSCHTKVVFRKFGRRLPDRGPDDQWRFGRRVGRSELRHGDLVFFDEDRNGRLGDHDLVSIYTGGGEVTFASNAKNQVVEMPMKWLGRFFGAKRIRV
jgi:hypothetical protein